jgi:glycosyltransferase involved in cell wall biosynthesis
MKIIAILENEIGAGGGFGQALNAILQMRRLCEGRFGFEVFTTRPENVPHLEGVGLKAHVFAYSMIDRLLRKLSLSGWWLSLQSRIRLVGPLEKELLAHGCDLAYFVVPGNASAGLQKLNYMTTVWDLCHHDTPEFPEVRDFNGFFLRERHYRNDLGPAVIVLTDSEQLAAAAARRYGVDPGRFLPMPFAPSPFLQSAQSASRDVVLSKYNLEEGYFFYPAQFWAHKNHIRILEALSLLKADDWRPKVVFPGKDCGSRAHLEAFVSQSGLQEQVIFLGFVPAQDLRGLYEGSFAVVMPTYFGPTNLPPYEAWALEKPLIYSATLAEQAGDAALLVDPDNANELAMAMKSCNDPAVRKRLVESGTARLQYFAEKRESAEGELLRRLNQFATRLRCWK